MHPPLNARTIIGDLLHFLDLRVLTVQRTAAGNWRNLRRARSPFTRLWLVLDGQATVRHHHQTFTLGAGSLHLVPAFTPHDCDCTGHLDHVHVYLLTRVSGGVDLFSLIECDWQVKSPVGSVKWLERLAEIYPDRKLPGVDGRPEEPRGVPGPGEPPGTALNPAAWWEAQAMARLLLAPFIASARLPDGLRAPWRFVAVQEFIGQNLGKPITLSNLAAIAGLNPTYFSDRFQQVAGLRPLEYLMRRRMQRARHLLLTSRAPVKAVAFAVGLPDPAHFTRLFARHHGISPSAYRAVHDPACDSSNSSLNGAIESAPQT